MSDVSKGWLARFRAAVAKIDAKKREYKAALQLKALECATGLNLRAEAPAPVVLAKPAVEVNPTPSKTAVAAPKGDTHENRFRLLGLEHKLNKLRERGIKQ